MPPKKYKLVFLPLFEEDLNEITDYIANELHNPDAALQLVDDIEAAISERLKNPLAFAPYQSRKERLHPYYRINVRNYTVFYVVIDEAMEVRRVIYSRRNIDMFL